MSRDTCKYPSCDREPGQEGNPVGYHTGRFCSAAHAVKYDHLKADARQAERDAQREVRE